MNALRRYLTAVLVGLATVAATSAQERVDTVAEAFAAMWSHYLTPLTSPGMASDSERLRNYTDGFRMGLRDSINETYVQGYYEGVQLAARLRTLHGLGLDVDARNLTTVLARIFAGGKPMMAPLDAEAYITSLIDVEVRPQGPSAEEQQAFLDEVASRSGVERTPSGLLFEIVQPGTGESPGHYDTALVSYTGTFTDGREFDSTGADTPIELPLDGVVDGMAEGLKKMRKGGTYRLFIPPALAYGSEGVGDVIPPGAVIIFEVTLVDVIHRK